MASALPPLEVDLKGKAPATPRPPSTSKAGHHLAAGALSGFTSAICLQPLDLLKTRLQQGPSHEVYGSTSKRCICSCGKVDNADVDEGDE